MMEYPDEPTQGTLNQIKRFFKTQKEKYLPWLNHAFEKPDELKGVNKFYLAGATLFGCGYFKYGSGTLASVITAIVALFLVNINHTLFLSVTVAVVIIGFVCTERVLSEELENRDPYYIVIDEVVGQLIPFVIICGSGSSVRGSILLAILSVVIFRLLDIYKPWIIGKSEKVFRGATAVMIDDIIAGFFTLIAIFIISLLV